MIGASLATRYRIGITKFVYIYGTDAAVHVRARVWARRARAHASRVQTALLLRTFDRLDCAANAKIN